MTPHANDERRYFGGTIEAMTVGDLAPSEPAGTWVRLDGHLDWRRCAGAITCRPATRLLFHDPSGKLLQHDGPLFDVS